MSVAEKLKQIAENEQRVYDAGEKKGIETEYDRFWDKYQENGAKEYYRYAFAGAGWNNETVKPKYDIVPTNAGNMFVSNSILSGSVKEIFDEQGITFDLSKSTDCSGMFNSCSEITELPYLDFSSTTMISQAFYGCRKLKSLNIKLPDRELNFLNAFRGLTALESIKVDGVIASDVSFEWSKLLSKESITSIVNALSATTEGKTLALSETAVETAFGVEEIQLSPDEFDADYLAHRGYTVIDNGDGSLTVSSEADARGGNIFCSPDNLSEGVYEVSYLETEGETQNSLYVYIYDTERQPVSIFDLHSGDKSQITLEEGYTLELSINLSGGGYVNNTLTPSLKRLDWESLKATKPNWNISLV